MAKGKGKCGQSRFNVVDPEYRAITRAEYILLCIRIKISIFIVFQRCVL